MNNTNQTERQPLPRLFHDVHHALKRYFGYRREQRLSPEYGQGRLIELLRETGPLTQKRLAYFLGIRQQSLGELVRKLEDAGYVVRETSPEDKRAMLVSLTDVGRALEIPESAKDSVFDCLSEEERENLREYLERLRSRAAELVPEDAHPGRKGHCCRPHPHGPEEEHAPHHHRGHSPDFGVRHAHRRRRFPF